MRGRVTRLWYGLWMVFGTCVDVMSAHKDEMLMNLSPNSYFQAFCCVLFLTNTNYCPLHTNDISPILSVVNRDHFNNSYFYLST